MIKNRIVCGNNLPTNAVTMELSAKCSNSFAVFSFISTPIVYAVIRKSVASIFREIVCYTDIRNSLARDYSVDEYQ